MIPVSAENFLQENATLCSNIFEITFSELM